METKYCLGLRQPQRPMLLRERCFIDGGWSADEGGAP